MEEHHVWPVKLPPEECPDPGSLGSLAAIYRELCRIDDIDRRLAKSKPKGRDDGRQEDNGENSDRNNMAEERTDASCQEVTWQLDRHRHVLRERAMKLSRDTLRDLSVLDLPIEILAQVFGYFQHQDFGVRHNGSIYWPSKVPPMSKASQPLLTIYNARQVCRLFNAVASPHLCPFLNLKLDQESLDRAEILLANPYIASGVVGIQVSLEYRPIELAIDLERFAIARKDDLLELDWPLDGEYRRSASDEEDPEPGPYELRDGNYRAIIKAWNHFLGLKREPAYWSSDEEEDDPQHQDSEEEESYEPNEAALEFCNILCESHRQYAKLQKSQHDLIRSRSFVKTLSSLASRLDRPLALRIHNSLEAEGLRNRYNPHEILTDKVELGKFLVTAHHWGEMDEMRGQATLTQAKILSELPIAMHKAGVVLKHLTVGCLPRFSSFSKLCPGEDESPDSPVWGELSVACKHLDVFQGEWDGHPVRVRFLKPEYQVYIERYVNSVLSGQQFGHVHLTLSPYSVNSGNGSVALLLPHMPGVLADISWPRVKKVSINSFSLHQDELESFCNALSSKIEYIGLISINLQSRNWVSNLQSGSWVNILDVLRDKMANSRKAGRCRVWMADLRGGELGQRKKRDRSPSSFRRRRELDDPGMVDRFRDYVKGELDENPAAKK